MYTDPPLVLSFLELTVADLQLYIASLSLSLAQLHFDNYCTYLLYILPDHIIETDDSTTYFQLLEHGIQKFHVIKSLSSVLHQ